MAIYQIQKYSLELMKQVHLNVIIPDDVPELMKEGNPAYQRKMQTLMLLHGFSGNESDWLTGSNIVELSLKYNLAVVLPAGDNSFYLNGKGTGMRYENFLAGELPDYLRERFGMFSSPTTSFIGGLSMGGFGAIRTGLAYPELFGKIGALSAALIIHNIGNMQPDFEDGIADYDYYVRTFGDLRMVVGSSKNPEYIIQKRKKKGERIQPIFMACGETDFLISENRSFHEFLEKEEIEVEYHESPGVHEWKFWNEWLEPMIHWFLE